MNIAAWIVQSLLAGIFLVTGGMKVSKTREILNKKLPAVSHLTTVTIRSIGLAEVLGGLGMILPGIFGVGLILTPLAATGLAMIMVAATEIHIKKKDWVDVAFNLVILAMTIFVAWHGFS